MTCCFDEWCFGPLFALLESHNLRPDSGKILPIICNNRETQALNRRLDTMSGALCAEIYCAESP